MKLLMCKKCGDIFNLIKEEKACGCGETRGKYIDNIHAEIEGNCHPIGFVNESFIGAYYKIRDESDSLSTGVLSGVRFEAFFISISSKTIHWVKEK